MGQRYYSVFAIAQHLPCTACGKPYVQHADQEKCLFGATTYQLDEGGIPLLVQPQLVRERLRQLKTGEKKNYAMLADPAEEVL